MGLDVESQDMQGGVDKLFANVVEEIVRPNLLQRIAEERWPTDQSVYRFQVLYYSADVAEVRLNDEVRGGMRVVVNRSVEKGERVDIDDVDEIKSYERDARDGDTPHVTGFLTKNGWNVTFGFSRPSPRAKEGLALARDFLMTAHDAFQSGRLRPALDLAYSAAELLAEAELLACEPTAEATLATKRHPRKATIYRQWARLDNTDPKFPKLLSRLTEIRNSARYSDATFTLDEASTKALLCQLDEMAAHVAGVVDHLPGAGPRGWTLVAKRPVKAGQIVTSADVTFEERPSAGNH